MQYDGRLSDGLKFADNVVLLVRRQLFGVQDLLQQFPYPVQDLNDVQIPVPTTHLFDQFPGLPNGLDNAGCVGLSILIPVSGDEGGR
ncbi:hypothetical protein D3C76_1525330 [compost metagenome]